MLNTLKTLSAKQTRTVFQGKVLAGGRNTIIRPLLGARQFSGMSTGFNQNRELGNGPQLGVDRTKFTYSS